MSRARRATWAALALCALCAPATAQEPIRDPEQMRARVRSLLAEDSAIEAELERQKQAALARLAGGASGTLDTVRVGPLAVVSSHRSMDMAARTVGEAIASFEDVLGGPTPLDSTVLLVEHANSIDEFLAMQHRPNHVRVMLPQWRTQEWRRGVAERFIGLALARGLPADTREWLSGQGVWPANASRTTAAYRSMVASSSPSAQACLEGALDGCRAALGLTDPGVDWARWYTEEQLVAWAVSLAGSRDDPAFRECDAARTRPACALYVRARGMAPPLPLPAAARATFMSHVTSLGGIAAYDDLRADTTGPLEARFARAAGASGDSLVASWRASLVAARPEMHAGLGGSWLMTLFWTVVLAAIAMRSTRWRLG